MENEQITLDEFKIRLRINHNYEIDLCELTDSVYNYVSRIFKWKLLSYTVDITLADYVVDIIIKTYNSDNNDYVKERLSKYLTNKYKKCSDFI